jgi:hypothetical protein
MHFYVCGGGLIKQDILPWRLCSFGLPLGRNDAILRCDCTQLAPHSKDKNVDASIRTTSGSPGSSKERFPCLNSFRGFKKHLQHRVFGSRQSNVQTLRTREASLPRVISPFPKFINAPSARLSFSGNG